MMTIALVAVFVAVAWIVFHFLASGPFSLHAEFQRDLEARLRDGRESVADIPTLTEADIESLPEPVQQYVRASGAIGQPRVHNFNVRMHGRIRSGAESKWMPLNAEQYNFVGEPARLFYLTASMYGIPVQGYHRYVRSAATMRIKAAALVPIATAGGDDMTRSETVTMFNDMCVLAPATLVDPRITWLPVDPHVVDALFTNAGYTIRARLVFNEAGELSNFWSDDRLATSPDGRTMRQLRWSTPIGPYRRFGAARLASAGTARWHEPGGEYSYIELTFDGVTYNVSV